MTFAELVQSKLPTRLLGARIEKVERLAHHDGVKAFVTGTDPIQISTSDILAANIDRFTEKWDVVRAILYQHVGEDRVPPDPSPMAKRAMDAQLEASRPDPEPPRWRSGLDGRIYPPPAEVSPDNKFIKLVKQLPAPCPRAPGACWCEDLAIRARADVVHVNQPGGVVGYGVGGMYHGRRILGVDRNLDVLQVAKTPPPNPLDSRESYRGIDLATYPEWKAGISMPALTREMIEEAYQHLTRHLYDAFLIPPDMIDPDGHWNPGKMARIANVDVAAPDSDRTARYLRNDDIKIVNLGYCGNLREAHAKLQVAQRDELLSRIRTFLGAVVESPGAMPVTAQDLLDEIDALNDTASLPPPSKPKRPSTCPHFKVDYPSMTFSMDEKVPLANPSVPLSAVRTPDDCPHCLQGRVKMLREALGNMLSAFAQVPHRDRPPDSERTFRESADVVYADMLHPIP